MSADMIYKSKTERGGCAGWKRKAQNYLPVSGRRQSDCPC